MSLLYPIALVTVLVGILYKKKTEDQEGSVTLQESFTVNRPSASHNFHKSMVIKDLNNPSYRRMRHELLQQKHKTTTTNQN